MISDIIRDGARNGHQPNIVGFFSTQYKDVPIKGGMTIPNRRSLDSGTCDRGDGFDYYASFSSIFGEEDSHFN